jgi:hypothetical protein
LPRPARCGGQAIDRLKAGGLAGFVTSHHTMDKADNRARAQIASMADLVGAIRLPEGSFRAAVGTEVGVDLLFFRKLRTGKWQDQSDHDRCIARTTGRPTGLRDVVRSFRKLPSACLVHSCAGLPTSRSVATSMASCRCVVVVSIR